MLVYHVTRCFLLFIIPIKLIHIAVDYEVVSVGSNDIREETCPYVTSIWKKAFITRRT